MATAQLGPSGHGLLLRVPGGALAGPGPLYVDVYGDLFAALPAAGPRQEEEEEKKKKRRRI